MDCYFAFFLLWFSSLIPCLLSLHAVPGARSCWSSWTSFKNPWSSDSVSGHLVRLHSLCFLACPLQPLPLSLSFLFALSQRWNPQEHCGQVCLPEGRTVFLGQWWLRLGRSETVHEWRHPVEIPCAALPTEWNSPPQWHLWTADTGVVMFESHQSQEHGSRRNQKRWRFPGGDAAVAALRKKEGDLWQAGHWCALRIACSQYRSCSVLVSFGDGNKRLIHCTNVPSYNDYSMN